MISVRLLILSLTLLLLSGFGSWMLVEAEEETTNDPQQQQKEEPNEPLGESPSTVTSESSSSSSDETTTTTTASTTTSKESTSSSGSDKVNKSKEDDFVDTDDFDPSNEDWGTYYDPQNIFCGKYDCYKILGFDYETFGTKAPSRKVITKRYRKLGLEWHPDRRRHKNAEERFVKIARAYEVLTSKKLREEYDSLRYDQEAYFRKYGTSVFWSYAPKSDATMVILALIVAANVAAWYIQQHRWQLVADRLVKAAAEDWNTSQGGTPESKQLRKEALAIYEKRQKEALEQDAAADAAAAAAETNTTNGTSKTTPAAASPKRKAGQKTNKKVSKEKKTKEQQSIELVPILKELVWEMSDFGGGFRRPTTWKDLLIVQLSDLPYKAATAIAWNVQYYYRRFQKKDLNDNERQVLTERAVGPVVWDTATEEAKQDMIKRELWIQSNLVEWKEEQEFKNLTAAEQKAYQKLKKKGKLE